jgi:hypothetical protein
MIYALGLSRTPGDGFTGIFFLTPTGQFIEEHHPDIGCWLTKKRMQWKDAFCSSTNTQSHLDSRCQEAKEDER